MEAFLLFFHRVPSLIREIGLSGLVDMAIVTLVIYSFVVVVKRTRRSGLIFTGILISTTAEPLAPPRSTSLHGGRSAAS